MTLTDQAAKAKGPPRWLEPDQVLPVQGRVGEDIVIEPKLRWSDVFDELRYELLRGDVPIPSDRYRVQMRGNVVQLTLKQTQKDDTGHYALVATRVGQGFDKGSSKKIHLSVDEPSEEGDPPTFLRRLTDLAVKVGTRTRFLVEIRSSTTPMITWHRNAEPVHAGSRFSFVHEGNFYCVDVAPVTVEDEGHWTCMAENRGGRSSCTSQLTVIVPKAYKRPEFVEELRALLTETGTVSLECKVVGVPTPVLRWFKDNKEIKAGDVFALTANPDDPTSLGIYTCEAVNCMGIAYSSSKVHVVGKGSREGSLKPADSMTPSGPLPIFIKLLQDECCRIGDTLRLSCQVQVPPWPKAITWYNKEGRIEPSEKYHVMEDGLGGYFVEVYPVEAMDEGEWKCVATSAEDMKQFTTCYVAMSIPKNYRKPRFMESLKAVLTEEGLVSFECKVVGFPTPLLRWFKDGQELKPGDVYQLTGTNSLGSYCCIARNCMGEAKSTAELTIEDIQNQLNEEERLQLLSTNQPPTFIKGLRSCEARINEDFRFTVQVSISPEPSLAWYRDDMPVEENEKYQIAKGSLGTWHLDVKTLEFVDQAEWKCVATNDHGQSVTSCFLKLIIPKHYKKPKFLESLRAILSEEGAVNLECKVIGVPQPILKWYKDGVELKPGDIHRIISGQDGTCCLGTYTCEATNCMGTVSSSASLLGFEDKFPVRKEAKEPQSPNGHELARNLSLSTIHEERTSQLYDTPQTDHSVTLDDRGEVSFSFDGKEVSVSLYETPDLTEEEALQISSIGSEMDGKRRRSGSASANTEMLQRIESINKTEEPYVEDVADKSSEKKQTTSESDRSLSKSNKERLLDNTKRLKEPVLVVRDTLVSIDNLETKLNSGSEEECRTTITENIIKPIQILCEEVSSIESKALKNAGDRSLNQTVRISLLEAIGGPTEELLRGMELIERQENVKSRKTDLIAILESLTDPVDEILMGITKIEHELTGRAIGEKPIALIRMISAVSKLDENVRNALTADKRAARLAASLEEILNTLDFFLNDVSVDPTRGTIETVDTVVVESLSRSIEDMARALGRSCTTKANVDGGSNIVEELATPTRELKAKLDTLRSALETYETKGTLSEYRTKLIESLRDSVGQTVGEIQRMKEKKPAEDEGRTAAEEPRQDILKEVRSSLQEALKSYENVAGTLDPRLSSIFDRVDEIYRRLRTPQKREIGLESLTSLEGPLYSLQCALTSISIAENSETIFKLLEPVVSQLRSTITSLNESSLQPILEMVGNIEGIVRIRTDNELEEGASSKSMQEEPENLIDGILDPLIDVQSALSTTLEDVDSVTNGATSSEKFASSEVAACLVELRQYVSDAAHTAMTLRVDETLSSLMDLKEPLLDLLAVLASEERSFQELPVIRKIPITIEKLKTVVSKVLEHSRSQETIKRTKDLWKTLGDVETQLPKTIVQLTDAEEAAKHVLERLNVDQGLSNVHFALSSVLERQERNHPSYSSSLTICIEDLRQSIGSSAVAIANLKHPVDEQIVEQVALLKESLLSLQRSLLTQEHEPEEEQVLKDLTSPVEKLKNLIRTVVDTEARTDVLLPVLELLDEIEKDTPLIAKEASKKKARREAEKLIPKREEPMKQKVRTFGLADKIFRSLDPMKHWLSATSEESTKDEEESALSSTVDELKRDVNKIAIETSYSEPPSDENLIEALVDLREPLTRLRNAIAIPSWTF
ncbi:muscle M-line assembly protein unc-89-like [Frieseomelitta varia]|uniref:muscle M-line assembly protein unc-89-like n=1 Tax=Frieseomelitta varia TaxID=561572 RepID=UPI001CB6A6B6|nr:muscle M-line assembly protein unc-89-like [Frieseomelitta varia]